MQAVHRNLFQPGYLGNIGTVMGASKVNGILQARSSQLSGQLKDSLVRHLQARLLHKQYVTLLQWGQQRQ